MTYAQRLRKLADSTGLDAFGDEIRAIADEMDACGSAGAKSDSQTPLSLTAAKRGEEGKAVPFLLNGMRFKMSFQTDLDADLDPITTLTCFNNFQNQLDGRWVALVAAEDDVHLKLSTPQPAQATQAEVTDALRTLAQSYVDEDEASTSSINRLMTLGGQLARAILALRPAQVPMTDEQRHRAYCDWYSKTDCLNTVEATFHSAFQCAEVHHGITAQAKKEDA